MFILTFLCTILQISIYYLNLLFVDISKINVQVKKKETHVSKETLSHIHWRLLTLFQFP